MVLYGVHGEGQKVFEWYESVALRKSYAAYATVYEGCTIQDLDAKCKGAGN